MLSKAEICVTITTDVPSLQLRVDYCLFVLAYAFAFAKCISGCHVNVQREVPGWPAEISKVIFRSNVDIGKG